MQGLTANNKLDKIILCSEGHPEHHGMLSSISGFHPPIQVPTSSAQPDLRQSSIVQYPCGCKTATRGNLGTKLNMRTSGAYFPWNNQFCENGCSVSWLQPVPNQETQTKNYLTLWSPLYMSWLFLKHHNNWWYSCPMLQKKIINHSMPVLLACLRMEGEQSSKGHLSGVHRLQDQDTLLSDGSRTPASEKRQPCLHFPGGEQITLHLDKHGAWQGLQAPEETSPFFFYTFLLCKEPLMVFSQCPRRERNKKNLGYKWRQLFGSFQIVPTLTDVPRGRTPPVPCLPQVGWVLGTVIHTERYQKPRWKPMDSQ